jgi:glycosyltransferase involved in cell wall biosynthesis
MKISIVIVGGVFQSTKEEADRIVKFTKCLKALNCLHFEEGDEVVISEFGMKPHLEKVALATLQGVPLKHVYTPSEGEFFNQSIAKNKGSEIASGDIILYINSDILLTHNTLSAIRNAFRDDPDHVFAICSRHDVFLSNYQVDDFISHINDESKYDVMNDIVVQDPGWLYALDTPNTNPPTYSIRRFIDERYNGMLLHDFMQGYFVFGDCFAVTKNTWKRFPFDDQCLALTDVFLRDMVFNHGKNGYRLVTFQEECSCFHLSGSDYAQQTQSGSPKEQRLHRDQVYLSEKYEELHHWFTFGYHTWCDEHIQKFGLDAKSMIETYRTPIYWKFFQDKEHFCRTYGVSEEIA